MAINIDFNSIDPILFEKAEKQINEKYNDLNFAKEKKNDEQFDNLTKTLLRVHAMLIDMHHHSPMAYLSLISNMRCTNDVADFNYDPLQPNPMVLDYDFMTKEDFLDTEGDFIFDINTNMVKGGFEFKHTKLQEDRDYIYSKGVPATVAINIWQKMRINDLFKFRCIPFISYATVENEPDMIYLNVIPKEEWETKRRDFSEALKGITGYYYQDGYVDHVYTSDSTFKDVAHSFHLRNSYINGVNHYNRLHPWLFDVYCMVSKKNGTLDSALSPVYMIRDYMRKARKIIMPIDLFLIGETNIDGSALCSKVMGVGKSSPTYNKCDRNNCTCYNPFRGRDFRSVLTKSFYKHLSISEYRDATDELRIGYVFSKDSNPNCVNCRGAKGVCPCKDNYRNALMLRDCPSLTAVAHVYVLGESKASLNTNSYHIDYIEDLDSFRSHGSSTPIFCVPDGKTIWNYERNEKFIREFRTSIRVYSLSPGMLSNINSEPDDDTIASLMTPMNLFTDDSQAFDREETKQIDEMQKKILQTVKNYGRIKEA